MAFSTTVGQNRVSANLTNSLALSEPAEFGGTSLSRIQPVFQRAVNPFVRIAIFWRNRKNDDLVKNRSRTRPDTVIQRVTHRELDEIALFAIPSKMMNP